MKSSIFLLSILIIGCETHEGFDGASKDITEAKKRGIFVSEYSVFPNPYRVNRALQFPVKEAWIERDWGYGKDDETIIQNKYQLCINSTEETANEMDNTGKTFGIESNHYLRTSGKDSFLGDFDSLPGDTIKYYLQPGHNLRDDSTEKIDIIGILVLVRKR